MRDIDYPPMYRLLLWLGRPFGLRWVGDNQQAAIYRLERYLTAKGPGFFWINPFTQRVREVINTSPDFVGIAVRGIRTNDAQQIGLAVALAYTFDLKRVRPEKASVFANWTAEVRKAIMTDQAQRALQSVVPHFYADQIFRGEVFRRLEQQFLDLLANNVAGLGLEPVLALILQVESPSLVQRRYEQVLQRQINLDALTQYRPAERAMLSAELRTEAVEAFQKMNAGRQYINMTDLTNLTNSAALGASPATFNPPPVGSGQVRGEEPPAGTLGM